jgi:uracil-DNA glycosylase
MSFDFSPPPRYCPLCPRLCGFREQNQRQHPSFYNGPVPSFGRLDAEFLVVGLAPGLKGANQTGRPFTGDYAGIVLYSALQEFGFAKGDYSSTLPPPLRGRDGVGGEIRTPPSNSLPQGEGEFTLINCRITNAVRCVPQENKPEPSEIKNCNSFLIDEIKAMPNLKMILSLGLVSHNAVLRAHSKKPAFAGFSHGARHLLSDSVTLTDSYHCSRYNINTGRLTQAMFNDVVQRIAKELR